MTKDTSSFKKALHDQFPNHFSPCYTILNALFTNKDSEDMYARGMVWLLIEDYTLKFPSKIVNNIKAVADRTGTDNLAYEVLYNIFCASDPSERNKIGLTAEIYQQGLSNVLPGPIVIKVDSAKYISTGIYDSQFHKLNPATGNFAFTNELNVSNGEYNSAINVHCFATTQSGIPLSLIAGALKFVSTSEKTQDTKILPYKLSIIKLLKFSKWKIPPWISDVQPGHVYARQGSTGITMHLEDNLSITVPLLDTEDLKRISIADESIRHGYRRGHYHQAFALFHANTWNKFTTREMSSILTKENIVKSYEKKLVNPFNKKELIHGFDNWCSLGLAKPLDEGVYLLTYKPGNSKKVVKGIDQVDLPEFDLESTLRWMSKHTYRQMGKQVHYNQETFSTQAKFYLWYNDVISEEGLHSSPMYNITDSTASHLLLLVYWMAAIFIIAVTFSGFLGNYYAPKTSQPKLKGYIHEINWLNHVFKIILVKRVAFLICLYGAMHRLTKLRSTQFGKINLSRSYSFIVGQFVLGAALFVWVSHTYRKCPERLFPPLNDMKKKEKLDNIALIRLECRNKLPTIRLLAFYKYYSEDHPDIEAVRKALEFHTGYIAGPGHVEVSAFRDGPNIQLCVNSDVISIKTLGEETYKLYFNLSETDRQEYSSLKYLVGSAYTMNKSAPVFWIVLFNSFMELESLRLLLCCYSLLLYLWADILVLFWLNIGFWLSNILLETYEALPLHSELIQMDLDARSTATRYISVYDGPLHLWNDPEQREKYIIPTEYDKVETFQTIILNNSVKLYNTDVVIINGSVVVDSVSSTGEYSHLCISSNNVLPAGCTIANGEALGLIVRPGFLSNAGSDYYKKLCCSPHTELSNRFRENSRHEKKKTDEFFHESPILLWFGVVGFFFGVWNLFFNKYENVQEQTANFICQILFFIPPTYIITRGFIAKVIVGRLRLIGIQNINDYSLPLLSAPRKVIALDKTCTLTEGYLTLVAIKCQVDLPLLSIVKTANDLIDRVKLQPSSRKDFL